VKRSWLSELAEDFAAITLLACLVLFGMVAGAALFMEACR
jgi:hypothetical protein